MKASKLIHGIAVASLGYYTLTSIILRPGGGSLGGILSVAVWSFLIWKLAVRPRSWGLGIGIFIFITIAVQVTLWRVAITSPRRDELGASVLWETLVISLVPLFLGGVGSLSLRWLYPEEIGSRVEPPSVKDAPNPPSGAARS